MWSHWIRICWKKECYNPFQIYQYFKYSSYSRFYLSQTRKGFELNGAWDCVVYDFIGEMIFCWHHYRCRFLKSVRIGKRIISQIYITNKNKNFGKESPSNILSFFFLNNLQIKRKANLHVTVIHINTYTHKKKIQYSFFVVQQA